MANYDNVYGVGYTRFVGESDEPEVETREARVEEMYVSRGDLDLSLETPDGHIRVSIPIKPRKDWDDLVGSLPTWDGK